MLTKKLLHQHLRNPNTESSIQILKNYPNISKEEMDKYNIFIDEINNDNNQDIAKLFIDPNTKEKLIFALKENLLTSEKILFLEALLQNNYELIDDDCRFLEDIVNAFNHKSFYSLVDFFKGRSENLLRFTLEKYKDCFSYIYASGGKLPQSKKFKLFDTSTLKTYKNSVKVILDETIKVYTQDTHKPTFVSLENDGYLTEHDLNDYKELLGIDLAYYRVTFKNGVNYFTYLEKESVNLYE